MERYLKNAKVLNYNLQIINYKFFIDGLPHRPGLVTSPPMIRP